MAKRRIVVRLLRRERISIGSGYMDVFVPEKVTEAGAGDIVTVASDLEERYGGSKNIVAVVEEYEGNELKHSATLAFLPRGQGRLLFQEPVRLKRVVLMKRQGSGWERHEAELPQGEFYVYIGDAVLDADLVVIETEKGVRVIPGTRGMKRDSSAEQRQG